MTRSLIALCLALPMLATSVTAGEKPAVYATPQDIVDAMLTSLSSADPAAHLIEIFGSEAEDLLSTGNAERNAENRAEIAALFAQGYRFQPASDGMVTLLLGAEGWPFPVPISRVENGWHFDIPAGRDEVYFRRVGENELNAIDVMLAYVDIQMEYRLSDHDGDGVMEFAASLLSDPGERDGLFWAEEDGPMGDRIARASLDGYNDGETDRTAEPYGGYYYRILSGQTIDAPGGPMTYSLNGNMVAGHALLAVPSDYGVTGIHSFMVAENGIVMQADMGENSLDIAFGMRLYDPGEGWQPVD